MKNYMKIISAFLFNLVNLFDKYTQINQFLPRFLHLSILVIKIPQIRQFPPALLIITR